MNGTRTLPDLGVYVVLDTAVCRGEALVNTARAAVDGGAMVLQLRDKTGTTDDLVRYVRAIRAAIAGRGARLLVNDDVEAARMSKADGVHVGQGDMTPDKARAALGDAALVGLSVETAEQASVVDPTLVDYVGAGPVFATATKADHATPLGWSGLATVLQAAPVPGVAIGGITAEHAAQARAAGAAGIAVVSAVCGQADPIAATMALRAAWEASG